MRSALCAVVVVAGMAGAAMGQTFGPAFEGSYTLLDMGSAANVPGPYGGVTFKSDNANTLLLGAAANSASGSVYAVPIVRGGDGHITGFAGPLTAETLPSPLSSTKNITCWSRTF